MWVSHHPRLSTPQGGNTRRIWGGVNEKEWGQLDAAPVIYAVRRAGNGAAGGYPPLLHHRRCAKKIPPPRRSGGE